MVQAPIYSVLNDLEYLENDLFSHIADQVQTLIVELKFLRTFLMHSEKWRDIASNNVTFCSILKIVEDELTKADEDLTTAREIGELGTIRMPYGSSYRYVNLNNLVPDLLEKVEVFKPDVREACMVLSKYSSQSSCRMGEKFFLELFESILENLKDLCSSNGELIVSLKKEILALEEKIRFMEYVVGFTRNRCSDLDKREYLLSQTEAVVDAAAPLAYLCWLSREDTSMLSKMEDLVFNVLQKTKLSTPEVIEMYVGVLKASVPSRSDIYLAGEIVVIFVNFLLEDFLHLAKDQIGTLHEGLVLMMAMVMEPPEEQTEEGKLILSKSEAVIDQATSFICSFQAENKKDNVTTNRDLAFSSLLEKIQLVKTEVIEIYPELSEVPPFNFPRTDGLGFTDFLLGYLRKLLKRKADSVYFVKHQIETIVGELEFFRSFLMDTTEQRNLHKELKDLGTYVTGAAYEAEYVIESFLRGDSPTWFYILRLSNVVSAIQLIKEKVAVIYDEHSHHVTVQNVSQTSNYALSEPNVPEIDEVMVGFHDEAEKIIERLTRGSVKLDIVAIVGMPGLGKTTLAKKVYGKTSIKYHFYIRAWCFVSQVYGKKDLLLTILSHIIELTDEIHDLNSDDLDEVLRRRLKGNRYLIVMDDLWNTKAWDDLKNSFPNDNNGSRILFTSRLRDVALQAKPDCNPHSLRLFSDEESWELIEKKLFQQEGCPEQLLDLGRKIAKNCKGLPLSVVLIAGLLAKTEKTPDWWKFLAERLSSERVGGTIHNMDIVDLSYKHLPDHLKPCFLYFGAFPEDEEIPVWKLVCLWIAEGFVHNTELKSLEDLAEDYLVDLISRSLVIVAKRRSKGGVKTCRVHDVLHDFCVEKAKKENFLQLKWGSDDDCAAADVGGGGGGGDDDDDDDDEDEDIEDDNDDNEDNNDDDNEDDNEDENEDNNEDNNESDSDGTDSSDTYEVRRIGIYSKWEQFSESMTFGPRVGSLLFFGTMHTHLYSEPSRYLSISYRFKLLKVLDLGCINIGDSFPREIILLVHLRFLAVRGRMNSIPSSISLLWNLETFLVKGLKGAVELPDTIWEMVSLRHLHVNNRVSFSWEDGELDDSSQLENLVSVSTLSLGGIRTQKILARLTNVRKLKCIFFESWDIVGNCIRFPELNSLNQLESLKVLYYGVARYPCVFSFPSNLKKLTLSKFRLPWKEISTIAKLRNLEVLKLLFKAFEGSQWNTREGEFLKLKFLKLDTLTIQQWDASADHFPCLQQLVLQSCKQLEGIPSGFGDIPSLQLIEVQWCSISASKSAKQILEEQQDMGNDGLKVFINPLV